MEILLESARPEETFEIAERLGRQLHGGEIICLYGDLGAGKTVFAKGLGKGLGIAEEITSPTFTLIQEYNSLLRDNLRFIHMDLYRLKYAEEAETIGIFDYFQDDCVCLIEWPELIVDSIPAERLDITIVGSGDQPRRITFKTKNQVLIDDLFNPITKTPN